jgi:hypothetical protein
MDHFVGLHIYCSSGKKKSSFMDAQLLPRIPGNQSRVSMDIQDPEVQAFAVNHRLNKSE